MTIAMVSKGGVAMRSNPKLGGPIRWRYVDQIVIRNNGKGKCTVVEGEVCVNSLTSATIATQRSIAVDIVNDRLWSKDR